MASSSWRFHLGILLLVCFGPSGLAYGFQNGSQQTADAVPEPNSNRILWQEGAQGAFTNVQGSLEYKYLRYQGKAIQSYLRSWGPYLIAYVGVTNANNTAYVLNSKLDISIQLRLLQYHMLPMETEQLVKLLQKGGKRNKAAAKDIQQKPWTLGLVTINGNSHWEELFYFHPDTEQLYSSVHAYERSLTPFDVQVILDGVAFVFPFKVGEP